jgi:putative ABC transport system permease protein
MFDLQKHIAAWKKKMQTGARLEDGDAEELASHLTDKIQELIQKGVAPEAAFHQAVADTGTPEELGQEHLFARERKTWQVTRSFLPALFVNYLKVLVRQWGRHRTHNWVTIGGLSVGIASCMLIAFYVLHEFSYDQNYSGKAIYRVINKQVSSTGVENTGAGEPIPLGPALKDEFPEVVSSVRFWSAYMPVLRVNDKIFQEDKFLFADSNAFRVFDFELIKGERTSVLSSPSAIVISEKAAKKYFGDKDPVGETIHYKGDPGNDLSFIVTGVFKDLPSNTHFSFDFLASFQAITDLSHGWGSFKSIWTYVELHDTKAAASLEEKFPAFVKKYVPDEFAAKQNKKFAFALEPVSSIHLGSNAGGAMKPVGSMALLRIMIFTGLLILAMSCVNFINISLAKMTGRLKEVGMRKVLGAVRGQLLVQFIAEVALAFLLSLAVAGLLVATLSPVFSEITGMSITWRNLVDWHFGVVLAGIFLFVVAVAGYIPAWMLSGYGILNAFRNKRVQASLRSPFSFRNALIFAQLAISGILIFSALIVAEQLSFIGKKDLGVTLNHVVAIPFSANPQVFENRLRALPGVESIGYSQRLPVNTLNFDRRIVELPGVPDAIQVESSYITQGFTDTYHIRFISGRNFNSELASDSAAFVINETAAKTFGWTPTTAIGKELKWSTYLKGEVIGVVQDFHLESVHATIRPMVMLDAVHDDQWQRNFISLRLQPGNETETRATIEKLWRQFNPDGAFMLVQMTDSFDQLHADDKVFSEIIFYFTLVAIFISAIGLYAVSSYTAEQRRKEIGIRKVLGSSIGRIAWGLTAPYMATTALSFVIVVPTVYYLMNRWLSTFAYHTAIGWQALAMAALAIASLAFLSVLKESLRAAFVNPVKFLREE